MGLEKPNSGRDRGETFFPNRGSDLDSDETFQISRNVGLDIDEIVCLLDSQLWPGGTVIHIGIFYPALCTVGPPPSIWFIHGRLSEYISGSQAAFGTSFGVTGGYRKPSKYGVSGRMFTISKGFLCTGGVSYALFISMLISKLFSTKGIGRGWGRESSPPPPSLPYHDKVNSLCPRGERGGG